MIMFLRHITDGGLLTGTIQLRMDPYRHQPIEKHQLPQIQAIYEDKNLARALNRANYNRLVGAASWLHQQLLQLEVPGDYNQGKLFHRNISKETLGVVREKV